MEEFGLDAYIKVAPKIKDFSVLLPSPGMRKLQPMQRGHYTQFNTSQTETFASLCRLVLGYSTQEHIGAVVS
jgi:hypothetical protein